MNKIGKSLVVLVIFTFIASACAPANSESSRLDTITEKGKLTCGTSADFPPMEFVNEDGTFSGFDIDFITEISKRLGVQVEIWDMPFDSLVQALAEKKVDCVIAAMGPTEERDKKVDFTVSYKMKTYVVMGNSEAPVEINDVDDIVRYRLGSLSGGLQVEMFHDRWIDAGMMPEENLVLYDRTDSGVLDLAAGRIDLWWTQDVVSQVWSQKANVYTAFVIPQEVLGGDTVICLPEGDSEMKAKFDEIITGMIEDGFRDNLLDTYGIPH